MTGLALHSLCIAHEQKLSGEGRCVKFTENFDNVDETVEVLPDSVKPGEPEISTRGHEVPGAVVWPWLLFC